MELADLDGDGAPELITGKQLLAHNGGDVGALEPVFVFYYTIKNGRFDRHVLSYSHLEPYFTKTSANEPPPNFIVGVGMKLNVADVDGNGKPDVIVACRSGLYVFLNQGPSPKTRGRNPLPDRSTYPGNIQWETNRSAIERDADGFHVLFNGKNLANWQPAQNWTVEEGVIALKNRTDRQEHNDNYLWTPRMYGDFVLEVEFKVTQGTNSGIYLRTSNPKDPVPTGIEVQVSGSAPGRPLGRGSIGGLYDLVAPTINPLKLDDWNQYIITCEGPKISVVLNGVKVSEADLDRWTEAKKNPDGSANKFDRPLKDFARTGYVGLQDHGSPVWYRKIRIKPLNSGR
jgi:hypothetical protein